MNVKRITNLASAILYAVAVLSPSAMAQTTITANHVVETAKSLLGVPYVWGGTTPLGFYCSGLTYYVFAKNGIRIPRQSRDQFHFGATVPTKNDLQKGDLVFFRDTWRSGISHVGIYIGNGRFIEESSSRHKAIISTLDNPYWTSHYAGAKDPFTLTPSIGHASQADQITYMHKSSRDLSGKNRTIPRELGPAEPKLLSSSTLGSLGGLHGSLRRTALETHSIARDKILLSPQMMKGSIVFGYVTSDTSAQDLMQHAEVNQVGADVYTVNPDGTVAGTLPVGLANYTLNNHMELFATVANLTTAGFNGQMLLQILQNPILSHTLAQNLVQLAVANDYAGINLDFEMLAPSAQAPLTSFITELYADLHSAGKLLNVTIPAETAGDTWDAAYDEKAIGQNADLVTIMAYDYSWLGSAPGPIAPLSWDDSVLSYATSEIPASKILLGLGAYGYDWVSGGATAAKSENAIDEQLLLDHITPLWDQSDNSPYYTYTDAQNKQHTVYYENQQSIADKLALAAKYNVAGISLWRLGLEDQGFWTAVDGYIAGH